MTSMARRMGIVATVFFAAGTMVGCGASSANTAPPVTAASAAPTDDDDAAASGLMEHHRYHHHGGVTLFIAMSLETLGVSPEQRAAVQKIHADLHARMEPVHAAYQNLATTLAEGIAASSFEAAKVDAAVAQVSTAAATLHDASVDALNELHAVLTPVQRGALVDKVESHWAVWQKANVEDESANGDGGHLATLAQDLALTTDQVNKVRDGIAGGMKTAPRVDPLAIAAHLRAFGDAFRGEKFDAKGLAATSGANAQLVGSGAARMARFVQIVSTVLTAEQRTKLAQRLREHGAHNPSAEGTL